jgi:site-specific recombinase XerD
MFNFALRSGYIKTNPFAFVKVEKKVKEVKPLTTEEYVKIMDVELSEKLGKVRDLFVFQCETGCAFSDAQSITFCDIERDENGELYVNKPRKKTGIPFFAVLSPLAMNILKKYNYSLDFISNQKCNEYLKQIATICGITKPLHSHIARHTAATNLLNSGVRLETVAAVLGHTTTRQTAHYAKLCKATVINEVQTARNKPTAKVLKVGNW